MPKHEVGGAGQRLVAAGQEAAVVEAMPVRAGQHAAQRIELLGQHAVGLVRVHRRPAAALAGGVLLQRRLQLVGDADVVHHQAALLVLEHAVHAGDGLHEVVALHRLVDVERVHAGRVEAGEPHVAHDHQAQRVGRVLEALLQPLLHLGAVDVRAQQRLVAGRARHHDLDGALLGVGAVPVGPQLDDLVVEVHADLAAHGHHHGLAGLRLVALLEVRHQVGRHAGDARRGAHHLLQRRPAALELGLLALFLVFGQLVDFVVDGGHLVGLQPSLASRLS
jgi:hypothetical protein